MWLFKEIISMVLEQYILFFDVGKYVKSEHVKDIPIYIIIGIPPHSVNNHY